MLGAGLDDDELAHHAFVLVAQDVAVVVHSAVHVVPGSIIWCGPPSIRAGNRMPCQCRVLVSPSRFVTAIRIRSPRRARTVGPR
jgi:hypothetical protein